MMLLYEKAKVVRSMQYVRVIIDYEKVHLRQMEMLQEIRIIRFEEAYSVWMEGRLTQ